MKENIKKMLEKNVNELTEKKNNLTYLSWANAWKIAIQEDENVSYEIGTYGIDSKPYLFDENLGYIVSTEVTMFGKTLPMVLPVMDNSNKAMKNIAYEYDTKNGKRKVEAATMFDINTAIMRCLVKNIALFGLGLYIYTGEDLPDGEKKSKKDTVPSYDDSEPF